MVCKEEINYWKNKGAREKELFEMEKEFWIKDELSKEKKRALEIHYVELMCDKVSLELKETETE